MIFAGAALSVLEASFILRIVSFWMASGLTAAVVVAASIFMISPGGCWNSTWNCWGWLGNVTVVAESKFLDGLLQWVILDLYFGCQGMTPTTQEDEMSNWTMETTDGFTQTELDILTQAQVILENANPGVDSKSISDRLNNVWNPGMTVTDLVTACKF